MKWKELLPVEKLGLAWEQPIPNPNIEKLSAYVEDDHNFKVSVFNTQHSTRFDSEQIAEYRRKYRRSIELSRHETT